MLIVDHGNTVIEKIRSRLLRPDVKLDDLATTLFPTAQAVRPFTLTSSIKFGGVEVVGQLRPKSVDVTDKHY